MSTLVAQTISNGTISTSSTTIIRGSARAWVNFTPSTGAVIAQFNVSSVTRGGTANYTVNFTSAFSNANYIVVGFDQYQRHSASPAATKTTTQWQATNFANDANGAQSDLIVGWFAFFGD